MRAEELFFYVGEKPAPTVCTYEDEEGDLIADISGATLVAKISIDGATEVEVPCTNNGDGSFTIDWPTGTSVFILDADRDSGTMTIDIEVSQSPLEYYLDRDTVKIKRRA